MKKSKRKTRKKQNNKKTNSVSHKNRGSNAKAKVAQKKPAKQQAVRTTQKKSPDKRRGNSHAVPGYFEKAKVFLKESRMELKKVKWPTKKELLATTAVVIFLTLLMALYFGIVDFGLIKIIKAIVR